MKNTFLYSSIKLMRNWKLMSAAFVTGVATYVVHKRDFSSFLLQVIVCAAMFKLSPEYPCSYDQVCGCAWHVCAPKHNPLLIVTLLF